MKLLFTHKYAYFSSYSKSWVDHAATYVGAMTDRFALSPCSTVVEIACNDGYLLQFFREQGIPSYGVEPTVGTPAMARAKGIETIEAFFGLTSRINFTALGGKPI